MTQSGKTVIEKSGGAVERPAAGPSTALKGKRILVVDDNPINLDIASETLLSSGAEVDIAAGGEEALKYLENTKYDLVLLDLTMPGIDGLTVGRAIRSSQINGETVVLLFTASDAGDAKRAVNEINAQGIVSKPVDIDVLLKNVSKYA